MGPHVAHPFLFKGSIEKPLLAPRGVFINRGKLFVSDTGQNRVFIWNKLPTHEFEEPSVILGQSEIDSVGRNTGGETSSSSLQYPSGIWSDGVRLIVADAWNHRVLIWTELPTKNGQAADVVLGQPTFESNEPNVLGIGAEPTANTLNWPYGVYSDGVKLWVADTGNRRVLYFHEIPTKNFSEADEVIGKPNFETRDYENNEPIWPYSVKVSPQGQLIIADTQFYRNLIWNSLEEAPVKPADIIIGQNGFDDSGQNQFGLFPSNKSLNWTYDACFYKNGILVNDTGNSRILWFDKLPSMNNAEATAVIGKPDFRTGSENKDTLNGTDSSLYWPFSIAVEDGQLIVADTGNHRLVFMDLLI